MIIMSLVLILGINQYDKILDDLLDARSAIAKTHDKDTDRLIQNLTNDWYGLQAAVIKGDDDS